MIGGLGAEVELPPGADPFMALFSESPGRVIVSVPPAQLTEFTGRCEDHSVPVSELGVVAVADAGLGLANLGKLTLAELARAWEETLPNLYGR